MKTQRIYRLLFSLLAATALMRGDWITIDFSGSIFSSDIPQLPDGTPYFGQASYETPGNLEQSTPSLSSYDYNLTGSSEGITISVDGYTFSSVGTLGNEAGVAYHSFLPGINGNDYLYIGDDYAPGYAPTGDLPGLAIQDIGLQLTGSPGLLTSPSLPSVLNLQDALYPVYTDPLNVISESGPFGPFDLISYAELGLGNGYILGSLDSINLVDESTVPEAAVPEPGSAGLYALALLVIGYMAKNC